MNQIMKKRLERNYSKSKFVESFGFSRSVCEREREREMSGLMHLRLGLEAAAKFLSHHSVVFVLGWISGARCWVDG